MLLIKVNSLRAALDHVAPISLNNFSRLSVKQDEPVVFEDKEIRPGENGPAM